MASKQMTYVEVEEAAEAIAVAVGSKSFDAITAGQPVALVIEDERDEWRAVARVAIAIHRAQQV